MSKGEIYIDLTLHKEEAEKLFQFINKINISTMKRNHNYDDVGTIYHYSGNNFCTSKIVFKIYKKHKELQDKGYLINSSLGIIRFELILKEGNSYMTINIETG